MEHTALVRSIADEIGILGQNGLYHGLDSLGIMDFISRLEEATGLEIPAEEITSGNFVGLDTTVGLLARLSQSS